MAVLRTIGEVLWSAPMIEEVLLKDLRIGEAQWNAMEPQTSGLPMTIATPHKQRPLDQWEQWQVSRTTRDWLDCSRI
jgi:hypothetical protein